MLLNTENKYPEYLGMMVLGMAYVKWLMMELKPHLTRKPVATWNLLV